MAGNVLDNEKILCTSIFTEVMLYKRFVFLCKYLHFINNFKGDDKMKNWPMTEYMNINYQHAYTPARNVVISESVVKCRG